MVEKFREAGKKITVHSSGEIEISEFKSCEARQCSAQAILSCGQCEQAYCEEHIHPHYQEHYPVRKKRKTGRQRQREKDERNKK